jgi:formyltetrahydrofolate-dependent phosphoribosylglycinamide formyltransferase
MCQGHRSINLALLLSGTGRTLQNIINYIEEGKLNARIQVVISSKEGVLGIKIAKEHNIPTFVIPRKKFASDEEFSNEITRSIEKFPVDLILMAGFLHFYKFPKKYYGKIMNIHPALLPKFGGKGFYGMRVHEAVIKAKEKESGCSVHFVDYEYDHGPIILQRRVKVLSNDTPESLASRVFKEECIAYPEAIRLFAQGKIKLEKDKVIFL